MQASVAAENGSGAVNSKWHVLLASFGASLAPYIATKLADRFGLVAVGGYLSFAAIIALLALWAVRTNANESATIIVPQTDIDAIAQKVFHC